MRVRWVWAFLDLPERGLRGGRGVLAGRDPDQSSRRGAATAASSRPCCPSEGTPGSRCSGSAGSAASTSTSTCRSRSRRPARGARSLGAEVLDEVLDDDGVLGRGRVPVAGRLRLLPDAAGSRTSRPRPGAGGAADPARPGLPRHPPGPRMPPRSRSGRRSPGGGCGGDSPGFDGWCGRRHAGAVAAAAARGGDGDVRATWTWPCLDREAETARHVALGAAVERVEAVVDGARRPGRAPLLPDGPRSAHRAACGLSRPQPGARGAAPTGRPRDGCARAPARAAWSHGGGSGTDQGVGDTAARRRRAAAVLAQTGAAAGDVAWRHRLRLSSGRGWPSGCTGCCGRCGARRGGSRVDVHAEAVEAARAEVARVAALGAGLARGRRASRRGPRARSSLAALEPGDRRARRRPRRARRVGRDHRRSGLAGRGRAGVLADVAQEAAMALRVVAVGDRCGRGGGVRCSARDGCAAPWRRLSRSPGPGDWSGDAAGLLALVGGRGARATSAYRAAEQAAAAPWSGPRTR